MASVFLVKDFVQMNVFVWICTNHEHVCLNIHCFCSFNNWLCDLISENWRLTLIALVISGIQIIVTMAVATIMRIPLDASIGLGTGKYPLHL